MRGTVLNKKGMYNKCKLTRLFVDSEWDERVWIDAWKSRVTEVDEDCAGEVVKTKRKNERRGGKKNRKLEDDNGVAWDEEVTPEYTERTNFLYSTESDDSSSQRKPGTIITFSGLEVLCRQVLKGVADRAVELSDFMAGVKLWEEWEEEVIDQPSSTRSEKEERRLWIMLEESGREQAKELERKSKKAARKVSQ